jgi:membrane protein required for colicin V production
MSPAFTFVDLATVVLLVVSAIYAVYRGFVAETLSIVAWAAAAFAALYFGPWVVPLLRGMIGNALIGLIAGYALVFVAVLIPLSFASARFSEGIKNSPIGPLDRSLGFAFGVVRGLAIAGIAYLIFTAFVPTHDQPGTVRDAALLPLIRSSSEVILALVPDQDIGATPHETYSRRSGEGSAAATPKPKPTMQTRNSRRRGPAAYGASERRALDRLIEATGSDDSGKR